MPPTIYGPSSPQQLRFQPTGVLTNIGIASRRRRASLFLETDNSLWAHWPINSSASGRQWHPPGRYMVATMYWPWPPFPTLPVRQHRRRWPSLGQSCVVTPPMASWAITNYASTNNSVLLRPGTVVAGPPDGSRRFIRRMVCSGPWRHCNTSQLMALHQHPQPAHPSPSPATWSAVPAERPAPSF